MRRRTLKSQQMTGVKEEDEEEGEECPGLEPFFFDEVAAVAEHEVWMRRKQEWLGSRPKEDPCVRPQTRANRLHPNRPRQNRSRRGMYVIYHPSNLSCLSNN
jgi:hypothetical protein